MMYGSTAVRMQKKMTSRYRLTLQERIKLSNELECRLTDIYMNSKVNRQTTLEDF
jgi:hypothetical protein